MSVLRVGVALVMGAMLLAVAAAKARQDGPKNGRPAEIRITSDGVAAAEEPSDRQGWSLFGRMGRRRSLCWNRPLA